MNCPGVFVAGANCHVADTEDIEPPPNLEAEPPSGVEVGSCLVARQGVTKGCSQMGDLHVHRTPARRPRREDAIIFRMALRGGPAPYETIAEDQNSREP